MTITAFAIYFLLVGALMAWLSYSQRRAVRTARKLGYLEALNDVQHTMTGHRRLLQPLDDGLEVKFSPTASAIVNALRAELVGCEPSEE